MDNFTRPVVVRLLSLLLLSLVMQGCSWTRLTGTEVAITGSTKEILTAVPTVQNSTKSPCWQQKEIAAQQSYLRSAISGKEEIKLSYKEFKPDPRPSDPQFKADWAAMYCREGTGYWKTSYDKR